MMSLSRKSKRGEGSPVVEGRARGWAPHRTVFALAVCSVVPLLAACPKKETPVFDAGPPPPPEEDVQTGLVLMEEDAGEEIDTGVDAPIKYTGTAVNTNVARLQQCCKQLAAEAKRMGSSPEASMFSSAAAQCSTMAAQAGPKGTAPELGVLRTALAGRNIPAICAGF
ncbi:MAG: hypothetical protein KF764_27065 [Labilithrix sp.]|nr:hypothetical protein [Labilithrix sp.]MBX3223550.1 hypothetical protein [Labilithrix sp.]